jgi:nucleoside-diphosphate-sugar epimerase
MKVLVLGGAGFIGPRVMRTLLDRGHQVACMDVNTNAASIADVRDRIDLFRGDITLMDDVMHAMLDSRPDRVLNLAYLLGARPDGVTGDQDPHYAVRLNILGMDN